MPLDLIGLKDKIYVIYKNFEVFVYSVEGENGVIGDIDMEYIFKGKEQ